jgi:hypothetical protein
MKNVIVLFILCFLINSKGYCFAEETAKTTPKISTVPQETKTISGEVVSIKISSAIGVGNKSEIVIRDEDGKKIEFIVRTGIGVTVSGTDKLISLKNIKVGEMVIMDYMILSTGEKKVLSIDLRRLGLN